MPRTRRDFRLAGRDTGKVLTGQPSCPGGNRMVVRASEWEFGERVILGVLVVSICGIIGSEEKIR